MNYFSEAYVYCQLPEEESRAVTRAYREHLIDIEPRLSATVQELTMISLHDGLVRYIVLDRKAETLLMALRCGDTVVGYFDLDLYYKQVVLTLPEAETLRAAARERSPEVRSHEVDIEPSGLFLHRVMFAASTGPDHEVAIRFTDLELSRTPRESYKIDPRKDRFIEARLVAP